MDCKPWHANESKTHRCPNFWIDKTEVTRKEYKIFLDTTGYRTPYVDEEWKMTIGTGMEQIIPKAQKSILLYLLIL